jgi:glutathione S-transferase
MSFSRSTPTGYVPTLLIDGRPLTEVAGILFYSAKRFPEVALLPEDVEAQAQVVSRMSFIASTVHPARRQGIDHARAIYSIADRKLGGARCAVGTYSIADIYLFRLFWRFSNSTHPDPSDFPNLHVHYDRMMARPAVQRTCEIEATIGYELPRRSRAVFCRVQFAARTSDLAIRRCVAKDA